MASGNEGGADLNLWRPGGKTDNGINEAIIDAPPKADINATSYVTPGKTLSRSDLNDQISANIATDFKNHPLRVAYEEEEAALSRYADLITPDMTAEALETLAREANLARRELGVKYKDVTAKPLRDYIYAANVERYDGDPLGGSYDFFKVAKGKSDEVDHLYTKGLPFAKSFKNSMEDYFQDCPELIEKVENKEFGNDELWKVLEFYNEKCLKVNSK